MAKKWGIVRKSGKSGKKWQKVAKSVEKLGKVGKSGKSGEKWLGVAICGKYVAKSGKSGFIVAKSWTKSGFSGWRKVGKSCTT